MCPPCTVCCFMSKGIIICKKGNKNRFNDHMNNEHRVVLCWPSFDTCKLTEIEKMSWCWKYVPFGWVWEELCFIICQKSAKEEETLRQTKPAEEQVMTSFLLLDQQSTSATILEEASVPDIETKKEASSNASKECLKVPVQLYSCDGFGK